MNEGLGRRRRGSQGKPEEACRGPVSIQERPFAELEDIPPVSACNSGAPAGHVRRHGLDFRRRYSSRAPLPEPAGHAGPLVHRLRAPEGPPLLRGVRLARAVDHRGHQIPTLLGDRSRRVGRQGRRRQQVLPRHPLCDQAHPSGG